MKPGLFPFKYSGWLGIVIVVWVAYIILVMCVSKAGVFGDTFGCLNALFTGLAFVAVWATLLDAQDERRFRLRIDLFDKRFQIYQAALDFVDFVNSYNRDAGLQKIVEHRIKFEAARGTAFFLFQGDADILDYLTELGQAAENHLSSMLQAEDQVEVGSPASKARSNRLDWFDKQPDVLRLKFTKHLSFKEFVH